MTSRSGLPQKTAQSRLIVVVRAQEASDYWPILETLKEAGVRSVELTMSTPGTLEQLSELVQAFGQSMDIGLGTVTAPEHVEAAHRAEASYLVTPVTLPELMTTAAMYNIPIIPGGLSPTELHTGWVSGAAAVKIFPASQVGSGYLKDLRGPFPDIQVIPSGGIDQASAKEWLEAGAQAVSVGGPLLGDVTRGGSLKALASRARDFVNLCSGPHTS